MAKSNIFGKMLPWLLAPLMLLLLTRPQTAASAVAQALKLWAQTVVPTLLPFMILTELLIASGGAQLLGEWLSPLMQPLFRLPGSAGVGVVLGFCAGFPTGAAVTAALRRQGLITAQEAAKLLAFTNNVGPLYLFGAVAGGLLGRAELGIILAVSHYGPNLLYGLLLGRCVHEETKTVRPDGTATEKRPSDVCLPLVLKAAAQRAAANVILIACLMSLFAAIAQLLWPAVWSGSPLGALLNSALEMTLGTAAWAGLGKSAEAVLPWVAAGLAFGGLSVQMQVLALIADTDISPHLYLRGRWLHPPLAWLLTRLWLKLRPAALQAAVIRAETPSLLPLAVAGVLLLAALVLAFLNADIQAGGQNRR